MVTYPLNELQPGMIVAADVFTPRGQLIVLRGSILSQQMIQHMKYYHVPSVTILPNEIDPMSFEKADRSEPTYAKRIRQSESFKEFREHYTQSASIFQEQLSRFVAGDAHLDTSALLQDTLELFDHNRASFSLLDMLHNMRDLDDSTYVHSINVAVISRLIGMWSDLDEANLDVLTLCGLLHDVGKVQIPDEILEKPDRLTPEEYEIMKTHTVLGYRIQPQIHPDLFGTYRPDLCRQLCPSERWQSGQDQHDRHKKTSPPSHPIRKRRICRSVQTSGSLCRRDHLIK